jgi:hypothetical protein
MSRRQGTTVQSSGQVEEARVDQRRRHRFGFSMGFSVRQAGRHFLAIQKKPDWMAQKTRLPYNVNGEGEENLKRKKSTGEYLAFLSVKYEISPDTLFCALLSAGENSKSRCGNLSIECRGKTKDKIIFLIMKDSEVVAQFPVSKKLLLEQGNPIGKFMETDIVRRHIAKETNMVYSQSIRDLRVGMRHVNLKGKVLEVTKPKHVVTRYGNHASLAKALIENETGKIKLCLWNEQVDSVSAGDTVKIENARVSVFSGERQLSLGKKGTLNHIVDLEHRQILMDVPVAHT